MIQSQTTTYILWIASINLSFNSFSSQLKATPGKVNGGKNMRQLSMTNKLNVIIRRDHF